MRKCVFFDADGTILDIKKGVASDVPEALKKMTDKGHLAFLCTGRSRALIPEEVEKLPFSGMITNLGGYIEYQGKTVYSYEIPLVDANRAMRILRKNGLVPVMEGNSYMYYDRDEYTTDVDWYSDLISQQLGTRFRTISGNEDDLHINKISAKIRPGCNVDSACAELSDIFDFIYHEGAFVGSTVECIAKGHSKGLAIAIISEILGINQADRIAFGDSNNDLPMFDVVHTKVAMGDGATELCSVADYITKTMGEGGITQGLKHIGLI